MNCAKCGGVVKAGNKFCPHCGSAVAAAPPVEPAPTVPGAAEPTPPPTTRYCMTCGGAVGDNQTTCETCGAPLVQPATSGPARTRLAEPIEASYEAVGSAPVQSAGPTASPSAAPRFAAAGATRVQAPPAVIKGSNRTFYQLLGVAFVLIACGYLGYHYWSSPPSPETRRAEGAGYGEPPGAGGLAQGSLGQDSSPQGSPGRTSSGPLGQGSTGQTSSGQGYSQGQPSDEYQAQSAPPGGGQQGGLGAAGGSTDRRAEPPEPAPLPREPVPRRFSDPAATRRPSSRITTSATAPPPSGPGVNPPPRPPPAGTLAAESRPPRDMANPPPAPSAVESPPSSPPPPAPAPVEAVPPRGTSGGAERAPPQEGGTVLLPGSQAWRVPANKSTAPDAPKQTASASPPARLGPRPPATPPQARTEGIIYWTGKLKKNQTIVIDGGEATVGFADGNLLPGSAVEVHIPSPAVALSEHPTPRNGWKRVAFRCLRSTKGAVTLNIQWKRR